MTRNMWQAWALRAGIGAAVALALIIVGPLILLRFHPVLALIVGATIGTLVWVFTHFLGPRPGPQWQQPYWQRRSALFQADVRTRRLAHSLAQAQPGQGFEARRVATQLADLTGRRLIAADRVPADDPLEHAAPHLSPALLNYLRSAGGERPQSLTRKALHAHLKEIDSL